MKLQVLAASALFFAVMPLSAQNEGEKPLTVVPSVDLSRYTGTWYEVARLPNPFQKDCVGEVTATYALLDNGTIQVTNRCRSADGSMKEAEGLARKASDDGPDSKLEVRFAPAFLSFLPFVWGHYWIIDLDPGYSYAVIGEPDRRYLWILARDPQLPDSTMRGILTRVKEQGYELSNLLVAKNQR